MYWLSSVPVQMPQAIMPQAIKCKRLFTIAKISMAWRPRKGIYGQRFASEHTDRLPTTRTYEIKACMPPHSAQVLETTRGPKPWVIFQGNETNKSVLPVVQNRRLQQI